MTIGLLLGRMFGGLTDTLDTIKIDTVSLPLAFGLLPIMYPELATAKYSKIGEVTADQWVVGTSLFFGGVASISSEQGGATLLVQSVIAACTAPAVVFRPSTGEEIETFISVVSMTERRLSPVRRKRRSPAMPSCQELRVDPGACCRPVGAVA